eukprot:7126525-Prymnesium_polylepis.3
MARIRQTCCCNCPVPPAVAAAVPIVTRLADDGDEGLGCGSTPTSCAWARETATQWQRQGARRAHGDVRRGVSPQRHRSSAPPPVMTSHLTDEIIWQRWMNHWRRAGSRSQRWPPTRRPEGSLVTRRRIRSRALPSPDNVRQRGRGGGRGECGRQGRRLSHMDMGGMGMGTGMGRNMGMGMGMDRNLSMPMACPCP